MVEIRRETVLFIAALFIILAVAMGSMYTIIRATTPVRIGVLLPLDNESGFVEPLEWARENINREGGINGRPLEYVYKDTSGGNVPALAKELLSDPSVSIVIGPHATDEVFSIAPSFIEKKKVLISPSACGGDLVRAFGGTGYFWRTMQSDVEQVRAMIGTLKADNVHRVALMVENTTNGKTFHDWTGFFAIESGITVAPITQFEPGSPSVENLTREALAVNPEYLIVVASPEDAGRIRREMTRAGTNARLFIADFDDAPALVRLLREEAEGIEGIRPAADPTSGFTVAYRERFGHEPGGYAAPAYDAALLAAFAAARQDAVLFESPADSVRAVAFGNGTHRDWDAQGSRQALRDIRGGSMPFVHGATGPLDFDPQYGVDPSTVFYSRGVVEDRAFRGISVISSEKAGSVLHKTIAAARYRASRELMQVSALDDTGWRPGQQKTDFRAVIVGPSTGWANYRHQSDALAVYTLLRESGVPDDHIILMLYDDIPALPENPRQGDVHNVPKGKNLRPAAEADYTGSSVNGNTLVQVLLGNRTGETPVVLESTNSTDVFVYIASHGMPGATVFSSKERPPVTAQEFSDLTSRMEKEGRYRQIVFFVDTCFGESVAQNATAKGMLYFTAASAQEPSLAAVYDMDIRQWLSDEFTATTLNAIREHPDITFRELYITVYERVSGSHVRMMNAENFGDLDVPVREFVKP